MARILFISPTGDFGNGAERSAYELMRHLVAGGHAVCNAYPAFFPSIEPAYRAAMEKAGVMPLCVSGLRWWPDSPIGNAALLADSPEDAKTVAELCAFIRENDIDTVVTNTVNIYHGAIAAREAKAKHIWLIHEFPENEFAYYRSKIGFISDGSDAVFSVAGALNECLSTLFSPRKVGSFFPYVEYAPASLSSADDSKHRLVCMGLITENKNQLELLQAYSLLPAELQNDLDLVFIGSHMGEYQAECEAFVAREGLQRVSFLGFLEKPWTQVGSKDILVLPSKMESFGCVFAEAAMNGTPVIASNCPGHSTVHEIFGAGVIYPLGDANALARAIENAICDYEQVKRAAIEVAPRVREAFSAENAYTEIVAEIARPRKPRWKRGCSLKRARKLSE